MKKAFENYIQSKNCKNLFTLFSILICANLFLLFFVRNSPQFENGVYLKYLNSILEDHDFNIINQFSEVQNKWLITQSFNHFDYHTPFISSLLVIPFSLFSTIGSWAKVLLPKEFLEQQFFIFLTLFTTLFIFIEIKKSSIQKNYFIFFLLTTILIGCAPVSFFIPSELSYIQIIFSFFILLNLIKIFEKDEVSSFSLAICVSSFLLFKFDGFYYFLATVLILFIFKKWRSLIFTFTFSAISFVLIMNTNLIRFNSALNPNPILFLSHRNYIDFTLFGANGWFTKSPFLFFLILTMVMQLILEKNIKIKAIILFALIVFFSKALSIGTGLVPVADYQANRVIITEIPFFTYSLMIFYESIKKNYRDKLIFILFLFFLYSIYSFWGWFLNSTSFDFRINYFMPLNTLVTNISFFKYSFINSLEIFKNNYVGYLFVSLLTSLTLTTWYYLCLQKRIKIDTAIFVFIFITSIYFSINNNLFNAKNANTMRQDGLLKNAVILKGSAIYYDEVIDMIEYGEVVSRKFGTPTLDSIYEFRNQFLSNVQENIIYDPIDFKTGLINGKIRKSFWQMKNETSN
jgi:hypothetical protein